MTDSLIRLPDVIQLTSISRTQIYRLIAAAAFPKQHRLSHKFAAWEESEIAAWVEALVAA